MRAVAACVLSAAMVFVAAAGPVVASDKGERVLKITDERIPESSGLAASPSDPSLLYTINDSDNAPAVYALDESSGGVVGVTTIEGYTLSDTEALGVGSDGTMWVADIGDNRAERTDIALYAFPEPGRGDSTVTPKRYPLRYRDGPKDAETLLVGPQSRRLLVVSKGLTGGDVYAVPKRLHADRQNTLRRVRRAGAPPIVTDGSFTPDGRRIVLRTYGSAVVYDASSWDELWSDALPSQPQGETLTVAPDGESFLIGTEGVPSTILRVELPQTDPVEESTAQAETDDGAADVNDDETNLDLWLTVLVGLAIVLVVLIVWIVLAARRSGRRQRAG